MPAYELGPLHLLAYHGNWYLLALNAAKGRVESFALSRFRRIEGLGRTFDRPQDFDARAHARQAFGIAGGEKPMKIRLLFEPKLAVYISERQWHPSQTLKKRPDGRVELRMETTGRKELVRWVLSWMPDVRVLAPKSKVPAAVMVIHTFGEYLVDFHPPLHALVADGLFDPQGGFHPLPEEIVLWPLEEMFRRRVIAFLVDQELLPRDRAEMLLSWQHSGFSLHRSRRVGHEEREDLEQIDRYILRNPFSTAKMHFEPGAGSVLYRSRMNKKQGGNFAALSPTDFIAAVTQHIPDKGFQLVRYYGWYSHKARGVRAKTGAAQAEDSAQGHEPDRAPTSAQWRRLIAKIWEADPLTCPDCGAEMRILAFIEEDRVIGRILRHLGLLPDASRGPPLQEPVYEPIYNDLPAVEEEDVVYQPF